MRISTNRNGITLHREDDDKRISHESTVTHHMRRLLNERDGGGWTRFYPDRVGLTSCRQGVQNKRTGVAYWHERYAIENTAEEFNKSRKVWYMAACIVLMMLAGLTATATAATPSSVAPAMAPTASATNTAPAWTLVLPVLTHHFPTDRGMNDQNWGTGVERQIGQSERWSLLAETYRNSLYRPTVVVGAAWMPIRLNRIALGMAAGLDLTHGYNRNPVAPLIADGRAQIQMTQRWALGVDVMPGTPVGVELSVRWRMAGGERRRAR